MAEVAGFWSYTHLDDESDQGRIRQLADDLKSEYGMLTGEELALFLDKEDIAWGDQWRERIEAALGGTTFLIPIATPRFFRSEECRRELLTFTTQARAAGVPELLLPVLYIDVPELTNEGTESTDEVIRLVAARQWVSWQKVRLADRDSTEYRTGVNSLAQRLVEIATEVAGRPSTKSLEPEVETGAGEAAPGLMDRIARAETLVPQWAETTTQLSKEMQEVEALALRQTERLGAVDPKQGIVGRLRVISEFAHELESPASRIKELGRRYASQLVEIDPAIQDFISLAEEDPTSIGEGGRALFASIQLLIGFFTKNAEALRELISIFDQSAGLARDLRKPIGEMKSGLTAMLDALGVTGRWEAGIEGLGLDLSAEIKDLEEQLDGGDSSNAT